MYQTQYVPAYTNHLLHFTLTLVTFGLWFPVWVTIWLVNHNRTIARSVWVPMAPQPPYQSMWQPTPPFPPQTRVP